MHTKPDGRLNENLHWMRARSFRSRGNSQRHQRGDPAQYQSVIVFTAING